MCFPSSSKEKFPSLLSRLLKEHRRVSRPQAAQQRKSGRLSYRNGVPYVLDPLSSDGAPAEDLSQSQLLKLGGIVDGTIAPKVTEVTHWDVDADPYATGASAGADGEDAAAGMLGSTAPQWIAYDRRVLRFFGFFKEPVVESAKENFRIRKVTIFYYLEDGTMHIGEPREDNSGIPQGVFLKRHVAELDSGEVLGIQHLNVGRGEAGRRAMAPALAAGAARQVR